MSGDHRLTIRIDDKLKARIDRQAAREHTTLTALTKRALIEYLRREERKQ